MIRLLLFACLIFAWHTVCAQNLPKIYPHPQQSEFDGHVVTLKSGKTIWHISSWVDATIASQLKSWFDGKEIKVVVGLAKENRFKKYQIPAIGEGYFLQVTTDQITLAGRDDAGLFYALQTLRQLITIDVDRVQLPVVRITDWPDVKFRGTVEGFYGKPWGHADRLRQIRFYGQYKMNTYIYGPKDDPFHGFSNQWRDPYPNDKAAQIVELVRMSALNRVNFIWAIHPGRDIRWTDLDGDGVIDDFAACLHKFELMYQLGVRSFAVFFDDISGEGTNALKQAEMLNYLNAQFVGKKADVTPLIMCPTQYNKAWSGGDYLDVLGNRLDRDIAIMWTGNSVCTDITRESMDWINARIRREAFIWWNWPVTDYVRTRLLLGRTYGLDQENKGSMAGFVSNPMDKPEASKIGLFGVADYTWNIQAFDSQQSWHDGMIRLFPTLHQAIQVFANHNSDQGMNTHGYRREESVDVAPAIERALSALKLHDSIAELDQIMIAATFDSISKAGLILKSELSDVNPALFDEIENWVYAFESLGEAGHWLLKSHNNIDNQIDNQMDCLNGALACFNKMDLFSRLQKEKGAPDPWARGCETGATVLTPFAKSLFISQFNKLYADVTGRHFQSTASAALYQSITNMQALDGLSVQRNGRYVTISPMLEVITLQPGHFFGVALPQGIFANYVHARLDNPLVAEKGAIQISADGTTWHEMPLHKDANELQGELSGDAKIRWVRFINHSDDKLELKIEQFKIDVPADARINDRSALYDGDPFSVFAIDSSQDDEVIEPPKQKPARDVYVLGDENAAQILFVDGSAIRYCDWNRDSTKGIKALRVESEVYPVKIHEIIWVE